MLTPGRHEPHHFPVSKTQGCCRRGAARAASFPSYLVDQVKLTSSSTCGSLVALEI